MAYQMYIDPKIKNIDNSQSFCMKPICFYFIFLLSFALFYFFVWLPYGYEFEDLGFMLPFVNDSDQTLCYKNYVWNEQNEHLRFKFILDDDLLEKSNGQNVFFHLTNCINNGIVNMTPR